jgi:hypothetical protein
LCGAAGVDNIAAGARPDEQRWPMSRQHGCWRSA